MRSAAQRIPASLLTAEEKKKVTRSGFEPETYGLTCRTGFHPPDCSCGLDFPISLAGRHARIASGTGRFGREPHVKSLRSPLRVSC